MSENIGDLSITIRVNKQTGELDVLKGQVTDTSKALEGLGQSSAGSSAQLSGLAGSISMLASATGVLASATAVLVFLKEAVAEATEEAEALRHLRAQMDALGISYDSNSGKIGAWASAMEELAHLHGEVAYDALGKTLQRTGDLAASMKIVQLAQDIFIATGRDFNLTLENLAVAAGGSSRGLSQLQIQFGQQISAANTAKEAIQILANNYGGAAEKARGLAVASMDSSIQLNKVFEKVGKELTPSLQFLSDYALKPVIQSLLTLEVIVKTVATVAVASVVGATNVIWTSVKSVGSVISAFVRDDWKAFNEAIKNGFTEMKRVASEQTSILMKSVAEGGKETAQIWRKSSGEIKEALESLNSIPVGPGKKETQAVIEEMNRRLDELRRQEAIELADKMLMNEEKIVILQRYAEAEIAIVTETKNKIGEEESKAAEKIAAINDTLALKKKQLEQEGLTNWRKGVEDWGRHITDTNARIAEIGKGTFDGLANSFGQATAKMLVSGKGFAQTFESLFRSLSNQVVAQLTTMIIKAAVLNAITGGTGTAFGIKFFAEGGRVYNPTYALIGEGGEPESVVPDSKAEDFARGVLAGKSSGGRGNFAAAQPSGRGTSLQGNGVNINLSMNNTINVGAGPNDQQIRQLIAALGNETADAITLALSMKNLADRNEGRAV